MDSDGGGLCGAVTSFPLGRSFLTSVGKVSRHFKHLVSLNEIKTSKQTCILGVI